VEECILSHRTRRTPAPKASFAFASISISLLVAGAGTSEALTLQRMAATVDVSKIVSAVQTLPADDVLLLEPLTADLVSQTTEFRIHVPTETPVLVEVTNDAGQCVCSARMLMPAGTQKVGFSGRDARGNLLPNGSYHYTVIAGGAMQTARVSITR
jgi:hypothetical protein